MWELKGLSRSSNPNCLFKRNKVKGIVLKY